MQTTQGFLRKYMYVIGFFCVYLISLFAQTFELQDFVKAIDKHAISLIDNKAQFESMLAERKSSIAWEYPTIEASGNTAERHQ